MKIKFNDEWSYEIDDNGYTLYSDISACKIVQHDGFSKLFIPDGTFEENAIAQLKSITGPKPEPIPTPEEKLRSDIDYLSLMLDVPLPSEEEEGE